MPDHAIFGNPQNPVRTEEVCNTPSDAKLRESPRSGQLLEALLEAVRSRKITDNHRLNKIIFENILAKEIGE